MHIYIYIPLHNKTLKVDLLDQRVCTWKFFKYSKFTLQKDYNNTHSQEEAFKFLFSTMHFPILLQSFPVLIIHCVKMIYSV